MSKINKEQIIRDNQRTPAFYRVFCRQAEEQEWQTCLCENISPGGMFIRTDSPAAVGSQILLKIPLFDGMEIKGLVSWNNSSETMENRGLVPNGMGVKFFELNDEQRKKIIEAVDQEDQIWRELLV